LTVSQSINTDAVGKTNTDLHAAHDLQAIHNIGLPLSQAVLNTSELG